MIFREIPSSGRGGRSYLIACEATRNAAIIHPQRESLCAYRRILAEEHLHLRFSLESSLPSVPPAGSLALREGLGCQRVAPFASVGRGAGGPVDVPAETGKVISLGDLRIECVAEPAGGRPLIAYRIGPYTFCHDELHFDFYEHPDTPSASDDGTVGAVLEELTAARRCDGLHLRSSTGATRPAPDGAERLRQTIREGLEASLAERRFAPREQQLVEVYLRQLAADPAAYPSAEDLARELGATDRTGTHVLVHHIRWKQIDLGRMSPVLKGQMPKWLKGIQTDPEFTPHEREFLGAYLSLLARHRRPPCGPEIARELGGRRSLQWIRKRTHTVRSKQRAFSKPVLVLNRAGSERPTSHAHQG